MNIEVAARLADLRKAHGLSQEQLAEKLNISRQAISKWERAESSPDTDNLIALAKLYQVSLDELVKMDPDSADDELFARSVAQAGLYDEDETPAQHTQAALDDFIKLPRSESGGINWRVFPYPVLVTIAYLVMGIFFELWHPGWLIFLTIPMYYTAIEGDHFNLNRIPYPLLVAVMYLILGLAWSWWHPGWLIFLTIPLYYTIMGRRLKSGINLILISVMLLVLFSLLGWAVGNWTRWVFSGLGAVLVVLGVMQSIER